MALSFSASSCFCKSATICWCSSSAASCEAAPAPSLLSSSSFFWVAWSCSWMPLPFFTAALSFTMAAASFFFKDSTSSFRPAASPASPASPSNDEIAASFSLISDSFAATSAIKASLSATAFLPACSICFLSAPSCFSNFFPLASACLTFLAPELASSCAVFLARMAPWSCSDCRRSLPLSSSTSVSASLRLRIVLLSFSSSSRTCPNMACCSPFCLINSSCIREDSILRPSFSSMRSPLTDSIFSASSLALFSCCSRSHPLLANSCRSASNPASTWFRWRAFSWIKLDKSLPSALRVSTLTSSSVTRPRARSSSTSLRKRRGSPSTQSPGLATPPVEATPSLRSPPLPSSPLPIDSSSLLLVSNATDLATAVTSSSPHSLASLARRASFSLWAW